MTQGLYLSNDMIIIMRMKFKIEIKKSNYDKVDIITLNRKDDIYYMTVII